MFEPVFRITARISKDLMEIEAVREAVSGLPLDVEMLRSLRQSARLLTTHYSTQIEGNRLTPDQVAEAVAGQHFPGRERDEVEVRNYYAALEEVEATATSNAPISESLIKRIHGLAYHGRKRGTPYRDGQNVVRDSATGGIVYMPPEASDVAALMADLVAWIQGQLKSGELPAPLVAGLAHYQFATIHPYFDGNGRTARLLTTLLLHRSGYGLKGIYSLEEYYARDLAGYYRALSIGTSHNYYEGRADADVTGFLEYFCAGMADAFRAVQAQGKAAAKRGATDQSDVLRRLDHRQRRVLELFQEQGTATTAEIAAAIGLSPRTAIVHCRKWVEEGFLEIHDPSKKRRSYRLAPAIEDHLHG
ncbi:MAG: cell filamentation protein Fic [Planctomycetes bacterium]|nr:cell filamentation protein Fic [Planctomycetota bacterium]